MIKLTIIMSLIICCVIVAGYKVIEIFSDFESFVQDVIEFAKGLLMFTILFSSLYLFFYWQFMILTKKVFSKIGENERSSIRLDRSDWKFNKEYYREIQSLYSPLALGYIDNFNISKSELISEILYLQEKNSLEINDGKLISKYKVLQNKGLLKYQIKILRSIKNGKLKITQLDKYMNSLKKVVESECERLKIIEKTADSSILSLKNIVAFLIFLVFFLVTIWLENAVKYSTGPNGIFISSMLFVYVFFYIKWNQAYLKARAIGPYRRTEKGIILNERMKGLKNYLKDYSLLSEREAKEIELWEDYLIYSVMFGQNKKVIEEYEKYIEIEEENGK